MHQSYRRFCYIMNIYAEKPSDTVTYQAKILINSCDIFHSPKPLESSILESAHLLGSILIIEY